MVCFKKEKCIYFSSHGYVFSTLCFCAFLEDNADPEGDNSVKLSRAVEMRELYARAALSSGYYRGDI